MMNHVDEFSNLLKEVKKSTGNKRFAEFVFFYILHPKLLPVFFAKKEKQIFTNFGTAVRLLPKLNTDFLDKKNEILSLPPDDLVKDDFLFISFLLHKKMLKQTPTSMLNFVEASTGHLPLYEERKAHILKLYCAENMKTINFDTLWQKSDKGTAFVTFSIYLREYKKHTGVDYVYDNINFWKTRECQQAKKISDVFGENKDIISDYISWCFDNIPEKYRPVSLHLLSQNWVLNKYSAKNEDELSKIRKWALVNLPPLYHQYLKEDHKIKKFILTSLAQKKKFKKFINYLMVHHNLLVKNLVLQKKRGI